MKKGKSVFLIIGIILVMIVFAFVYLVVSDLKQEEILKQEIVNLSNKDLVIDDYRIVVKTKGDYAYIEEAIKKFYKELSDSSKVIYNTLSDERLTQILSPDNLQVDKPKFGNSYRLLQDTRTKITEAITVIASLCDEKKIKSLIDKEKVDDYYLELYQELMYTEEDLRDFQQTKEEMKELIDRLNDFLDKIEEILKMLEQSNGSWFIQDQQIYFEEDSQVAEYNRLYQELNDIADALSSEKEPLSEENSQNI